MRIGAVVQRYGEVIAGGAERLAREVCTRLAASGDDVTVFTTTARDYVTWRNELPPGTARDEGVTVRRFAVASEREPTAFSALSERVFAAGAVAPTLDDELAWVRAQGPDSPALLAALWRERRSFEAWLFFTYLYAPTALGVPVAPEHAVLVPLAHNEAPIYLRTFKNLFRLPRALLFQTPEEQALVERVVPRNPVPGEVVGYGVDPVESAGDTAWPASVPPGSRYVLYLGRLDPSKGVGELLAAFASFRASRGAVLGLVLAGEAAMEVNASDGVIVTGFVSEEERDRLLAHAEAVIQPSRFESLSLVALEAWARARAVIAQRGSDVLVGQLGRSGGGFVYSDPGELAALLDRLAARDRAFAEAGRAGRRFVRETGSWERVIGRYRRALAEAAAAPSRAA